jgi:fructuronate reductase
VKRLSARTVSSLAAAVTRPAYDRSRLVRGIVHLGLGAFHRAHQAIYTDRVMEPRDPRWGIAGVSLRSTAVPATLIPQDHLYCVLEREGDAASARLVGAVVSSLHAPSQARAVLDAIADPHTHVVTSTVTEKGYAVNPSTGDLDETNDAIRHDLAEPDAPTSTIGVLFAGLRRRDPRHPLTVVCCDNMAGNGEVLRRVTLQYGNLVDRAAAARIEQAVSFPSSMVDRIVPAATDESLAWAGERLGLRDEAAIVCEPFIQWVIEDRFAGPRPAWERAGALLVGDVRPYQALKLRLLNGTHSAIAYLGQLRGLETVSDAMRDPLVGAFARRLMLDELRATVTAPPGYDVRAYCDELLRRFENPSLAHRTAQIAMDGTQKIPVRWLPALRASLDAGIERPLLERALAAWLHYVDTGGSDSGDAFEISDPGAGALAARMHGAPNAHDSVRAALSDTAVFGDAGWPDAFVARVAGCLAALRREGAIAVLR